MMLLHGDRLGGLVLAAALGLFGWMPSASASETTGDSPQSPAEQIAAEADRIVEALGETGDWEAAVEPSQSLMRRAYAELTIRDRDALTEAAYAYRLVQRLESAATERRRREGVGPMDAERIRRVVALLRERPDAGRRLVFLLSPGDDVNAAFAIFEELCNRFGKKVESFASLAAAVSVVHDRPLRRRVNENMTSAPNPFDLFAYFVEHEKRMTFSLEDMPGELLVYVVDSTTPIPEMHWALGKYRGQPMLGKHFFSIDYDYNHFLRGQPKLVTQKGFSLPNIQRYGGVCADQAYYAVAVGKSIGVPSAYTRGRSAELSHAWVGFFKRQGRRSATWDFSQGRYEAYQGVAGVLEDPQTGEWIGDGIVAVQAKLLGSSAADRELTAAVADACASVIAQLPDDSDAKPTVTDTQARPVSTDAMLAFLQDGLQVSAGVTDAWEILAELARGGRLNLEQKRTWAGFIQKLCGKDCPDFAWEMLEPMIRTVDDVKTQDRLWDGLAKSLSHRKDLMARATMARGEMWQAADEPEKAAAAYQLVIQRHANDGPFIMDAIAALERMLQQHDRADKLDELYGFAWSQCEPPRRSAFSNQSNYVRLGKLYAQRLHVAGQNRKAQQVIEQIEKL